jgi:hypothetical protein
MAGGSNSTPQNVTKVWSLTGGEGGEAEGEIPRNKFNYRFTVRISRLYNLVGCVACEVLNKSGNVVCGLWLGSARLHDIFGCF